MNEKHLKQAQEPTSGQAAAQPQAPQATQPAQGTPAAAATGDAPRKRAPKTNLLAIARGRLPLLFVHAIRFKESGGNAEVAKKYATSVGKVFDIKKGRNFNYINEQFKPTQEDVKAAQAWVAEAEKFGGDKGGLGDVIASYTLATPDEAKAQQAAISAARVRQPGQPAQGAATQGQPAQTQGKTPTPPAGTKLPAGAKQQLVS